MATLVIGDVMLDHYIIGSVTRISPEAPVPVVNVTQERFVAGGAANVASNMAALGAAVSLLGVCGKDANGEQLAQLLADKNIHNKVYTDESIPTICKTRIIGEKQQIVRVDREQKYHHAARAVEMFEALVAAKSYQYIVISDYDKGFCSTELCQAVVAYCQTNDAVLIIDPKIRDWRKYEGATLITPNLKELALTYGHEVANDDASVSQAAQEIKDRYNIAHLLITRSEKGMTLLDAQQHIHHFPVYAQEVYDVSGAGDTVIATLATFLSEGYALTEAVYWANCAAGYVVSKFGTYVLNRTELVACEAHIRQQKEN